MSDFDYGNARIRAMKSRLLSRQELEALLNVDTLQGLIAALTNTSYRKPVEAALARASGMQCIAEALHIDLVNTLGRIRNFYQDQSGKMVAIVLRAYDIFNLKTILRGLAKNIPAGEILSSTLPIGELDFGTLADLASAPDPRACTDLLVSMGLFFARPLLELQSKRPGTGTAEMELVLDQWYFQEAFKVMQQMNRDRRVLIVALQLEADLINLLSVLRFAHIPTERNLLRDWLDTSEMQTLFVGPGMLPFSLLVEAGTKDSVADAIESLSGTPYETPLNEGLQVYAQSAKLSAFEKQLTHFRLNWMSRQIRSDPLGIGVLLGYLNLKVNEVNNIRWIAQAIQLELKPVSIHSEMVFVS